MDIELPRKIQVKNMAIGKVQSCIRAEGTCGANIAYGLGDVDFSGGGEVGHLDVEGVHLAGELVAELKTLRDETLLCLH